MSRSLFIYFGAIFVLSTNSCGNRYGEQCRLPGSQRSLGRCVPVEKCSHAFANVIALQFDPSASFQQYLQRRSCGNGAYGVSSNFQIFTLKYN